ncbi:MAG: tetratricopeptide repeat protein [Aliifodinibius sp.]|nr:tetratricopeptide repeat protein [Fodinibius sp.]NIV15682.1 tetratricopeptide repeat protein [Fodinibius sp.]NIY29539.1 tetratricopeptide repeat protein [Fodinibius sp.]
MIINLKQTQVGWKTLEIKKPTRKINIPNTQILQNQNADLLKQVVDTEYRKTKLGRQYFERLHREHLSEFKHLSKPDSKKANILHQPASLSPKVEQQFLVTQYTAAVIADPSDFEAWLQLAHIHYELDEKDKALAAINKAWELNQDDPQIINARACTLAEYAIVQGGPKSLLHEAIELFESLRGEVATSIVDYNIGNSLAALDEHEKAIKHFEQALSADPSPRQAAQIWKNRGSSFYSLGNRDEEIKSFKRALELNPQLWQAYASWAASEVREENFEEAAALFIKALQANPDLETSGHDQLYWLAYSLFSSGNLNEAYRRVNQLLSLKPEYKNGQLLKTHILSELWRDSPLYIPSAISFFKARVLDDTEDMFARSELYLIYNSEGYKDDARTILEETISLDTVPSQALYHYAIVLEEEQRFNEAIQYLELAFEHTQEHHIVHALARLKRKTGSYNEAIKFYNMALVDVSEPFSILRSIADCYYFLEDFRGCVRIVSKSILLGSGESGLWENLRFALHKLGLRRRHISDYFGFLNRNILEENELCDADIERELDRLLSKKA